MSKIQTSKQYIVKKDLKTIFPKEFTSRELIGKFFDYIMNNFFEKSYERYMNGYIGKKTQTLEEGNFYIKEPTTERQLYQLTPMLVDIDENNSINDIVDYTNFINTLKLQGSLVTDHNRLLSNEHWSFCPPIDVDMFLNYNFYYWIEEGVKPIILNAQTNAIMNIIGKKTYDYIYDDESGVQQIIPFKNGMRITFKNDDNYEFNNQTYIVEGVGKSIYLVKDNISDDVDINSEPDYFVMDRGCKDGNPWSLRNRWFHINNIKDANQYNQTEYNNIKYIQAKKPILCFNKDIELYNFGLHDRGWVDVITKTQKNDINGNVISKSDHNGKLFLEGKYLDNGAKILFTNENNAESNNMIYELFLISDEENNLVTLYPIVNGEDPDGKALIGDCIKVKNTINCCYHFNGEEWIESQQKTEICQSPLFNLYDNNKTLLNNTNTYTGSSFKGCTLFNYKSTDNKSVTIDNDIKRRLIISDYGNYVFDNTIISENFTYKEVTANGLIQKDIEGYKYYKIIDKEEYKNCWHLSKDTLTQYIITELTVTDENIKNQKTFIDEKGLKLTYEPFELAYEPSENDFKENMFVYVNGQFIEKGTSFKDGMYFLDGKTLWISLKTKLKEYDTIYVKMLIDKNDEELAKGYVYDLPLMLTSNGLNEDITEIKYNEMFDQCQSILENQIGFEGLVNGVNNYKDTVKDVSLGTKLLQHSTPILKTMLLNSKEYTNIRNVLNYISDEYTKFKNKFNNVIDNMINNGEYTEYNKTSTDGIYYSKTNPLDIIAKALNKINIGKEGLQPFYNNGVAEQLINLNDEDEAYLKETYIPSTPAYLGLDNCYIPEIIYPNSNDLRRKVLLCHDGSYQALDNDYRDETKLELEKQIYNSINSRFKDNLPSIIKQKYIPGKFRHTDYTYDEYIQLYIPLFEKWCVENDVDYSNNDTFIEDNTFTWNWSSCYDKDGFQLPGSYRAIYMYYYDTDKPHTNPWEMLGFGSKPTWWEEHYGPAPYTSENYPMWKDIEEGHIIDGVSEGYYEEFKRPGLFKEYLPVDKNGNLKDPYEIGITDTKPILKYANKPWKIGDLGHIENVWRYTSEYRYAIQTILFLMKPLEWVESSWDSINTDILFKGTDYEQIVDINTGIRNVQNNIEMHNEYINGEYIRKLGSQQWFSDFLVSESLDITNYIGNKLRDIDIRLGYRCAGYYDKDTLKIMSDNYGIIPSNNYHLKLSEKITGNIYRYSGIIIRQLPNGWLIDGFDKEYPYFNIFTPIINGKKSPVEINGRNFTYYHNYNNEITQIKYKTIITSAQEVYNIICGYEKYLESIGFVFNLINENGEQIDFRYCGRNFLRWYSNEAVKDGDVLLLNPMISEINLKTKGFVDKVGKFFNGHWSVINTTPANVYNNELFIYRHNGYISVKPLEPEKTNIASIKFTTSEKENVIIFDNETIYGDTLYNSLKGTKTERFKILGNKTNGWNGTYYAPGYIINNKETIEPNYDKLANDLNYIYDSDDIRSFGKMGDEARKTIGYHKTNYMENLLIDNRNMFDFYKGMLKEKGTKLAFNKLNRSTHIMSEGSSELNLDEHWTFKVGQFGYTKSKSTLEFLINAEDISHDPQIITFSSDPNYYSTDSSNIAINWNSKNWLKKNNENQDRNTFLYSDNYKKLPCGGFAQLDDCKYILENKDILEKEIENFDINDKIWIVRDNSYTWNMYKRIDNDDTPFKSLKVNNINELLSYDNSYLDKNDLIYVEKDILDNWIFRITDDDSDSNLNIYINDTKGLLKNQNYIIKSSAWSVFKYNGILPYGYILSMPNGIISIIDNSSEYILRIEKDLVLNLSDGKDENSENLYKKYVIKNNLPITLTNGKYIFLSIHNDNPQYIINNKFTNNDIEPITHSKNDFWYNPNTNLLSRWNGAFWENSSTKLYAWKFSSTKYYTLDDISTLDESEISTLPIYSVSGTNVTKISNNITRYIPYRYAWKYNNTTYYTLSETPKAGDIVYNNNEVQKDIISSFFDGAEYFYCDNKKYIRTKSSDIAPIVVIDGNQYKRLETSDIAPYYYIMLAEIETDKGVTDKYKLTNINVVNPYNLERVEQKQIDNNLIKSAYLVDNITDKTFSVIYPFDPLHCVLPQYILNEINFIESYDPVNYDDPNNWSEKNLGKLWWDTSKVRYIDYYQGNLKYRRDNWGKQLPGSEIAIMEWVKSTILPENIEKYITQKIFNAKTNKYDIYYYYWLQNPSELPEYNFRTMTAFDISRKINSPQDEDIIWFAPINLTNRVYDDSSFIIGNFDNVTTSQDFVIQFNSKNKIDNNDHNEWLMIIEDSDDEIPDALWNKMKYSLITEDDLNQIVPDPTLTDSEKYGINIRPRQSMFKDIINARKNFTDVCNYIFSNRDILTSSTDDFSKILIKDTSYKNTNISETFFSHESMMLNKDKSLIGKDVLIEHDELYDGIWTLWHMYGIGNYKLINYQKYDVSRYTYFIDAFLNKNYSKDTYNKKIYISKYDREIMQLINKGIPNGFIIRIDDDSTKDWLYLEQWNESTQTFNVIGIRDGYIQLNDNLFNYLENPDDTLFINNISKYDYLNEEVKKVIEILCDYFYNR